MQITALSCGPLSPWALHALLSGETSNDTPIHNVICITGHWHDFGFGGLRICPDLDAAVAAVRKSPEAQTNYIQGQLSQWGALNEEATSLPDAAIAAGLARNLGLSNGWSLGDVASAQLGSHAQRVSLVPVSGDPVELHVIEEVGDARQARHIRSWMNDAHRCMPEGFVGAGLEQAHPSAGVLEALRGSDAVAVLPMSPVLDAAGILGVTGVRDALRGSNAKVIVMSPVGLRTDERDTHSENAAWQISGLAQTSAQIAHLYRDFADVLLIDEAEPEASYPRILQVKRSPLVAAMAGDPAAMSQVREDVIALGK